jgi:hypothetical protein
MPVARSIFLPPLLDRVEWMPVDQLHRRKWIRPESSPATTVAPSGVTAHVPALRSGPARRSRTHRITRPLPPSSGRSEPFL